MEVLTIENVMHIFDIGSYASLCRSRDHPSNQGSSLPVSHCFLSNQMITGDTLRSTWPLTDPKADQHGQDDSLEF
jgi:hypothetical protein